MTTGTYRGVYFALWFQRQNSWQAWQQVQEAESSRLEPQTKSRENKLEMARRIFFLSKLSLGMYFLQEAEPPKAP